MAGEYIYTLQNLTKQHGAKKILEDVNLSFSSEQGSVLLEEMDLVNQVL